MTKEIFIQTTGPIEKLGGMERFLQYVKAGCEERGYAVRVFHIENSVPERWRHPNPRRKFKRLLADVLHGIYIGKATKKALHAGVRLVLSNSTVGWYPLGKGVKRAHFFHGTYRGQAEAIRPYIHYLGYLKLKWWDSMLFERLSGEHKIVLCCSELVGVEVARYFGYPAHVMWLPLDFNHFRNLDTHSCRQKLGLSEGPVGLFVGNPSPMKGMWVVQHLAHKFPEMTMLMATRGLVPEAIRKIPNLRVFQDAGYDLLPTLYNAADFSLVPSRYDVFSFAFAEAIACATPVIGSPFSPSAIFYDNPALKSLLRASTDDLEGFEQSVKLVISDPEGWRRLIQQVVRPRLEELMALENWWKRFEHILDLYA